MIIIIERDIKERILNMMHDFLLLEMYYGPADAAQYFEDVVKKHGRKNLEKARACGHIVMRTISVGPDRGRVMCWLSEQGREKAGTFLM